MYKYITKKITSISLLALIISSNVYSQTQDSASIGAGYINQTFYSMQNGTVSSVLNTDWDLAFQISGFEASILINSKNNVRLFRSEKSISQWSSITAGDTIGYLNSTYELFNSDTSWRVGSFNTTNNIADQFDLGWGNYDFATHFVVGDSLYYIKLTSGIIKKLWIENLANGIYNFKYADVDGGNEVTALVSKANYVNKNFGYYSITNGVAIDREPLKTDWDIVFNQYLSLTPFIYKVTGVLSNDSIEAIKLSAVNVANTTTNGQNYSYHINTIGYDWKTYDVNNNIWAIEDSTVYFIKDKSGYYWKLFFTGFSGASTGTFYFTKQQVVPTGIAEVNQAAIALMEIFPNPVSDLIHLVYDLKKTASVSISIKNTLGQEVFSKALPTGNGIHDYYIPCNQLSKGIYFITLNVDNLKETRKVLIQ